MDSITLEKIEVKNNFESSKITQFGVENLNQKQNTQTNLRESNYSCFFI
ncbi:unnamed protein product (macronuclear) [Paramecium tetraurelia]|uniref:Uncharacterized protein n=1 Tax=Paramecium tetraurelia TaxID=5888 RepID=A0DB04_PARTE|nr:uncharacterized protein GSPATT00039378001 [Paramecium tetraurelia]CAK80221.1 unnamed protein product [Paramecium tetraurelia]|eukprot:XP_001447618.1 hypothetical protein (macronuclear) [Paramecium tetraurelia strain d4-2]